MLFLKSLTDHRNYYIAYFIIGMCFFSIGLNWSMFMVSASFIWLASALVIRICTVKPYVSLYDDWRLDLSKLNEELIYKIFLFVVLVVMISGLWSHDFDQWFLFVKCKLPFLAFPFIMIRIAGKIDKTWIQIFWILSILSICITSTFILTNYIQNFELINQSIMQGGAMKTPISHIRYSIIIACSIIILIDFIIKKRILKYSVEKWIYIVLFIYLFITIHVMSVKSGLLGLYIALFMYASIYFFSIKKIKLWIVSILTMSVILYISYLLIPSLHSKIAYSVWQLEAWRQGKWLYFSDIERWKSFIVGWEMIKHYPILGTGAGDFRQVTFDTYMECLNHPYPKYPHNQFLFSWGACGLLGLASICGLVYLSIKKMQFKQPLFIALQGILLSSFLVEMTLETHMGVSIYIYYTVTSYFMCVMKEA